MTRNEGALNQSLGLRKFYQPYLFYPSEERIRSLVVSVLKGPYVLDAGCGNGWLSVCAWEKGYEVFSFDVGKGETRESLFLFKEKKANIGLAEASLSILPFADASFDSIMCISVLEHVPNVKQALFEMKRVLRRNGRLVLMIPNALTFGILYDRFAYRLVPTKTIVARSHKILRSLKDEEISRMKLDEKEPIGHHQQFTLARIRKLLVENDMRVTNVINCRFLAPYLRSFSTLLGREPVRAFERFDAKIVESAPSILVAEWIIVSEKSTQNRVSMDSSVDRLVDDQ